MSNLIRIKRSDTTAVPGSLANGELAWTSNGDVLYIGSEDSVVAIGGLRTPGILTANQALVANSTSGIDKVITANVSIGSGYVNAIAEVANLTHLGINSNNEIATTWAVKTYVDLQVLEGGGGASSIDQLNDVSITSATNNNILVYDDVAGNWENHTITGNSGQIAVNFSSHDITVALAAAVSVPTSLSVGSNVVATVDRITVGNSTVNSYITSGVVETDGNLVVAGTGTITGTLAAGNTTVTGSVNTTGNSNALNFSVGTNFLANSTGVYHTGVVNAAVHSVGTTFIANTTKLTFAGANVDIGTSTMHVGNTIITGDLIVTGTTTTVDSTNLVVEDSLIRLAKNQANTTTYTDAVDIGFYGVYGNTSVTRYTGLARDPTANAYVLFTEMTTEPDNDEVSTAETLSRLYAYLSSGALFTNSSILTITANSTVDVNITANTLALSTALPETSGGTGLNTYTMGDILISDGSNSLSVLSIGADGKVLQSNGTTLVYDDLDGGTF